jgi:hypothetical protein
MDRSRWLLAGQLWLLIVASVSAAAPSKAEVTAPERRWAILISASDYRHLKHFPSRQPAMALLAESLVQAGFRQDHVLAMNETVADARRHPTQANILRVLQWLRGEAAHDTLPAGPRAALQPGDEVLLVVALYGLRQGQADVLCPIDAQLDRGAGKGEGLLSLESLREAMSACRAGRKLLVLDAFSEDPRPLARGRRGTPDFEPLDVGRLRPARGYGELVGRDQRDVAAKDVSAFLNVVIAGLQGNADHFSGNRDGWVSLWELIDHVTQRPSPARKSAVVGEDFPLGRVQTEPPPPVKARHEVLMRLTSVLLRYRMNDAAIEASTRAIQNSPGPQATAEGYLRRADAHLGQADYEAALADANRADKPLRAVAQAAGAIQVGEETIGQVEPGQTIELHKLNGDFLGITTVDGQQPLNGWLLKNTCRLDPLSAGPAPQTLDPEQLQAESSAGEDDQPGGTAENDASGMAEDDEDDDDEEEE